MLLIVHGSVITRDEQQPLLKDGAVAIEGKRIVEVGARDVLEKKYATAEKIDAQGGLIMPGLINCHTHIYSGLARGLAIKGCNPHNFLENLEQQWWAIDRKLSLAGTRASAIATIMESIRCGVTTIFDHHASFGEIEGSLFEIKDAAKELGIRACLCYETSDRDGAAKRDAAIEENASFAKWAAQEQDDTISAMFGGHALFTLSDETLDKMVAANDGLTGFHIHVCEGLDDVFDSAQNYGTTAVHRLLDHGLLGEKTMLGHCIHVSPADMDIIAQTKTKIVNNPESNMGNAVGCAPVLEFFKHGIQVAMGTDAYTHDMFESLKVFVPMQRHNAALPNVAWAEAMQMLFANNKAMADSYFKSADAAEIGVLKAGAKADVAIFDYPQFTPLLPENIDGHLLFGLSGRACRTTIIDGKVIYKDRYFIDVDEEEMNAKVLEEAKRLWGDLNGRVY